jgi:hypothetical protein
MFILMQYEVVLLCLFDSFFTSRVSVLVFLPLLLLPLLAGLAKELKTVDS